MRLRIGLPNADSCVMGRNGFHTGLQAVEITHYPERVLLDFLGKSGRVLNASFFTDAETMDALCQAWREYRHRTEERCGTDPQADEPSFQALPPQQNLPTTEESSDTAFPSPTEGPHCGGRLWVGEDACHCADGLPTVFTGERQP